MYLFKVKMAGHIAQIETQHVHPQVICAPFFTEESPEFIICTTQEDIDQERKRYEAVNGECCLWDGAMETIALHEKLSKKLIDYEVLMMHGAAIAYRGCTFIFSARCGIGKSTHVLKWMEKLADAFIVNGDKPFILTKDDGTPPLACGSPWAGKENLYNNTMVPLKSIILMERAEDNNIEQISFAQAFPTLLQQTYRPDDEEKMRKTLKLMQRLNPAVSFWRFQCNNFKDDCFDVAYNALVKGQK